jgi:cell division protein ZapA
MSQISVPVNGRPFTLTCDDGQEARIRRLAQYVDAKVTQFVTTVGQVGDAKLLLLAALVITDEFVDANEALQQERGRAVAAESAALTNGVHRMSKPVETIAARVGTH